MAYKDSDDCDDEEFYGFCGDFDQNNERFQNEIKIEMGGHIEIIDTHGTDAEERQEAQVRYDQSAADLETTLGLRIFKDYGEVA